MWIVRVKDRGRNLVWHRVESIAEAEELRRVYLSLGYDAAKVFVENEPVLVQEAA